MSISVNEFEVSETLKKNITALREERGYSMKYVAEALGVLPNTYRVWEAEGGIRAFRLLQLAKFYGVSVDDLLSEHKSKFAVAAPNEFNRDDSLSSEERDLIDSLRALSDEDRKDFYNSVYDTLQKYEKE